MKNKKLKTIGVLGGMGPSASAQFYSLLIKIAQGKYGAEQDEDYPPIIIYSLPLTGFDETGEINNLVSEQLVKGVQTLEKAGADFIVIACNTVHLKIAEMRAVVNIPILNIAECAISVLKANAIDKVGVVCSQETNNSGLYEHILEKSNITPIMPNEAQQQKLNSIILNVMGGKQGYKDKEILKKIFTEYKNNAAIEDIVLACTELPLAISQSDTNFKLFNTLEILAQAAIEYSYKQ